MHETKLLLIKEQLQEALETDKDAMSSTLIVEGEIMSFEIEELKIRLREREIEVYVHHVQGNSRNASRVCSVELLRYSSILRQT